MNTRHHWGLLTLALALVFVATQSLSAQTTKYGTYYYQRAHLFETLPTSPDDIIFLGNSITDGGEWGELFGNINVKNRGISGDICDGILDRLSTITNGHPAKVFLMIGVNDMARDFTPDSIAYKVGLIVRRIKTESPETKVYDDIVEYLKSEKKVSEDGIALVHGRLGRDLGIAGHRHGVDRDGLEAAVDDFKG